jgi:hypothetical protein
MPLSPLSISLDGGLPGDYPGIEARYSLGFLPGKLRNLLGFPEQSG